MIHHLVAALVPPHDRKPSSAICTRSSLPTASAGQPAACSRSSESSCATRSSRTFAARAAGAAWTGAEIPAGYDPVSRALLELWASPSALGLLSALAAGLVAGRAGRSSRAGSIEDTPRRHVAIALSALAALSAPMPVVGVAAAGLCLSGAWFGAAARRS